ncbi:MAG TPA: efflux RND transporter periplasmic adaptor subunit [Steroidobacteraceae bacterium]|nr:efflux RND transporter periplasmic adaptor subunit [Steroidobacteraceae bacterium]
MIAVGAAVLAVVCLVLIIRHAQPKSSANLPNARAPGERGGPMPVSVATANTGDIELRLPALGTVTPLATITIRTQISGILQKIAFSEGGLVRRGELLAQIDPRPYEAAVRQMEGNLRRDQALLADAKLDLKRYEGLVKEDSIAVQQLDTQRALVDQYQGTIESDEGQLQTARVNLIYTRIVSPVDGRAGLRQVDQGNYVTPGDANGIVVVNQVQPITVIFPVPEDYVPALTRQMRAAGSLEVDAYDRANSMLLARGKLLTLDNQIDVTTGTVRLRAQFDNADGALFPNQFVNVQLLQEVLHGQVIMPNSAVRRGAPDGVTTTFVYIVNPDSTVSVRPVTLGVVQGDRAAVLAGLAAGDKVVTEGGDRLRDGAKVQLPGIAAAGAAAGASVAAVALGGPKKHHKHPRPEAQ